MDSKTEGLSKLKQFSQTNGESYLIKEISQLPCIVKSYVLHGINLCIILPYINRCRSLRGPCAKGQGDLDGKTFQNCLNMTDD